MVEIEKGVPIPDKQYGKRDSKYPFAQMLVGDSFAIEGDTAKVTSLLRNTAYRYSEQLGFKFTVRATDNGARVWRTA